MAKLQLSTVSAPSPSTFDDRSQADVDRTKNATDLERNEDDTSAVARAVSYQLADQTRYESNRRIFAIFLALALPIACFFCEQSILSTAQPAIIRTHSVLLLLSRLSLVSATSSGARGAFVVRPLSDVRSVLLVSISLFLATSLGCALAPSMTFLLVFRGLQGAVSGSLLTLSLLVIADAVPPRRRGLWQGGIEVISCATNAVAPILGGVIVEHTTWRWVFYLLLPLGGLGIVAVLFTLRSTVVIAGNAKQRVRAIDWGGSIGIVALCLCVLVRQCVSLCSHSQLPVNWGGQRYAWGSAPVIALFCVSPVVAALLMLWEHRVRYPVMPLRVFKSSTFNGALLASAVMGSAFLISVFIVPTLFQVLRNVSPLTSGLLILPLIVPTTASVALTGQVVARTARFKWLMVGGFALWSVGFGLLSTIRPETSIARIVGYQIFTGSVSGTTMQNSLLAAQVAVAPKDVGVAVGVRSMVRYVAASIGLSICWVIVYAELDKAMDALDLTDAIRASVKLDPTQIRTFGFSDYELETIISGWTSGFRFTMILFAALTAFACLTTLVLIRDIPLQDAQPEPIDSPQTARSSVTLEKATSHV